MVIHPEQRKLGDQTVGMNREQAMKTQSTWSGFVTTDPDAISGWHHHGEHESHIYILAGVMRFETQGMNGNVESLEAHAGDFVFVPPHVVHRESNPSNEQSQVVVFRVGSGDAVINLDSQLAEKHG